MQVAARRGTRGADARAALSLQHGAGAGGTERLLRSPCGCAYWAFLGWGGVRGESEDRGAVLTGPWPTPLAQPPPAVCLEAPPGIPAAGPRGVAPLLGNGLDQAWWSLCRWHVCPRGLSDWSLLSPQGTPPS